MSKFGAGTSLSFPFARRRAQACPKASERSWAVCAARSSMLCVQMMATGKEVATLKLSEYPEMACVRALKRHLSSLCGCPRFKQRILRDGTILADDTKLEVLAEQTLQLVLLEFLPTTESEVQELLSAAANSNHAKLEALLQRPQDPDLGAEPPLLASCRDGHLEVVRLLLEAEADVNRHDRNLYTPLARASSSGHVEVVDLLLQTKVDKNQAGRTGWTPLSLASADGHAEVVRQLRPGPFQQRFGPRFARLKAGVDTNAGNRTGRTPLAWACSHGHAEVVRLLLESKVLRLLLEARVDADTEDVSGRTPLLWASTHGHAEVVCLLLEARADKDKVSHKGKSALARAARKGHSEVVRHLLDAKAAAGDALLSALSSGHAEVVRMLLDATFSESFERDTKRQRTSFDTLVDCSGCTGSCRQAAVCTLLYGVSESGIAACLQDALWQVAKPAWVWYADRRVAAVCLFVFIVLSLFQWRRRIQQSRALELPAPHEEVELRNAAT
eukprot:s702_g4.t3